MAKDGCMDIFPYQIFGSNQESPYLCNRLSQSIAAIAQLVEHDLAKVGVASSSLVCRSLFIRLPGWWNGRHEGLKILWPVMAVRVQVPLRVL